MNLPVYCFNDSYQLVLLLNGIQHFLKSGAWSNLAYVTLVVLFVIGVLKFQRVDPLSYLRQIFLPFVLYVLIFSAPTTLNLMDEFSGENYTVNNVPAGVALPISFSTMIEKAFVDIIDNQVAPPDTPKFKEVDFFGHARLMGEVATSDLWLDAPLQQTLVAYYENCILPMMANGSMLPQTIKNSPNLLDAVASSHGSFFTPVYTSTGQSIKTCADAYAEFKGTAQAKASSTSANTPFQRAGRIFGSRAKDGALLAASYSSILNSMFRFQQDNMETLFLQNLMINGMRSSIGMMSPDILATISEAESRHYTTGVTAGLMYIKQLPKLRALFKLTLVALFPLVCAFFLAQSGRPFFYWAGCLLWISLWLPCQAAIHAAYAAESIADLRSFTATAGGYTWATNSAIVKWATETASLAAGLMLMIPILTGMVLRWAFPVVGATITGMLTGARGVEQRIMGAAVGATNLAGQRVLGLENDKFDQAIFSFGDRLSSQRKHANEWTSDATGGLYQPSFGQRPVDYSSQSFAEQTVGGHRMTYTATQQDMQNAQASQTHAAKQTEGLTRQAMGSALMSDIKEGGTRHIDQVTSSLSESDRNSFNQAVAQNSAAIRETSWGKNLSADQVATFATMTAAGAKAEKGFSFFGTGASVSISGEAKGTSTESAKTSESAGMSERGSHQDTTSSNRARGHDISSADQLMNQLSKFAGRTSRSGKSFQTQLAELKQNQTELAVATQRMQSVQSAAAHGSTLSIDSQAAYARLTGNGISHIARNNAWAADAVNKYEGTPVVTKQGAAYFAREYQRAAGSNNPRTWEKVFRMIDDLETAGKAEGKQDVVIAANTMREIATGQAMKQASSNANLAELDFILPLASGKQDIQGQRGGMAAQPVNGAPSSQTLQVLQEELKGSAVQPDVGPPPSPAITWEDKSKVVRVNETPQPAPDFGRQYENNARQVLDGSKLTPGDGSANTLLKGVGLKDKS